MDRQIGAALVGAGHIAAVHADVLRRMERVRIAAVVDPQADRAANLARLADGARTYACVEDLLRDGGCARAHVLVPPDLHRRVAEPLLASGVDVLLEKPLATTSEDCAALDRAAQSGGARLSVNQNALFFPAYLKLKRIAETGALGGLRHLSIIFAMPLRQLAAGQLSHWVFRQPGNVLIELAVHPLSQAADLLGGVEGATASVEPPRRLAPDCDFYPRWRFELHGLRGRADLAFAVGEDYPVWRIFALFSDGFASADLVGDRIVVEEATRWPEFWQQFVSGAASGVQSIASSAANAAAYVGSVLRLRPPSDPFHASMRSAIRAFHDRRGPADARFGGSLVELCERLAESAGVPLRRTPRPAVVRTEAWDVAVLGGTGFIGRHLVARLLAEGKRVGVLARGGDVAPAPLDDSRVALIKGDVARKADVLRAIGDAKLVVNLAQGAEGRSEAEIERAMADSARLVAEACLEKGVAGLVHASSIAALWLGDPAAVVTGATPPDPERARRAVYSRGKAAGEDAVLELHRTRGLPVCVLRPGVVVGAGGSPFHSGLGFYNRERHCMGWDRGDHPLPFVLVEDVAEAIVLALAEPARIAGRTYNLAGDVPFGAREYVAALARALGRPLVYHGQSTLKLYAVELGKWLIKRAAGRKDAPPSLRDLRSRGMPARFDCGDAKRDLGWRPVADRAEFLRRGVEVHGGA